MAYRYGQDRDQLTLFPQSIDQYVPEDHPVRAYDAFVDALDFQQLGIDLNPHKVGNSQYHPGLMLKLLLFGYSYGIKCSRKQERETYNNLAFIWLKNRYPKSLPKRSINVSLYMMNKPIVTAVRRASV